MGFQPLTQEEAYPSPALPEKLDNLPNGLFDKVVNQESRGHHTDATGNLTTSKAGAQGITQLMPATAKNPGYGIEGVKDTSEAEYKRVGKEYLSALYSEFDGDKEKAVAAYNAGPATVKKAIANHGDNWKEHLPEETKDYIVKTTVGTGGFKPLTTPPLIKSGFTPLKKTSGFTPLTKPHDKEVSWGEAAHRAGSEFQAATDVVLSTPAFIVEGLTTPLLAAGEAIKGTKDPIQTAEAKMSEFQNSKVGKALSLSTGENIGNKQGVDESTVNELFGKLTGKITEGSEKTAGKGTEGAAAIRLGVTALMAGAGAVGAVKGKAISKAVKDKVFLDKEAPKEKNPEFEASRIKKDETIGAGLARARDRKDQEVLSKTPTELDKEAVKLAYNEAKQAQFKFKEEFLKSRNKTVSDDLSKEELSQLLTGQKIVYDKAYADSLPKHKEAVVAKQDAVRKRVAGTSATNAKLGISENTVHELLPTKESIGAFHTAVEQHVASGMDHTQATLEALKTAKEDPSLTPQHKTVLEAQIPILEEELTHPTSKMADDVLKNSSVHEAVSLTKNAILALTRIAVNRSKGIVDRIEDEKLRKKITMSLDSDNPFHQLKNDKEQAEQKAQLAGSIDKYSTQLGIANRPRPTLHDVALTYPRVSLKDLASIAERKQAEWDHLNEIKHVLVDKLEKAKVKHEEVKNAPSEARAITERNNIKNRLAELRDLAVKAGVLTTTVKDYVPHILNWAGFKGTEAQRLSLMERIQRIPQDPRIKQDSSIQRQFGSIGELQAALEGTGVTVERDIAKIMETYEKNILSMIAHKRLIDFLKKTKDANGKPYIKAISDKVNKDHYVSFDGKGSDALSGLLVHPEVRDIVGHIWRQSDPGMVVRGLSALTAKIKSMNVVASAFHATTLGVAHLTQNPKALLSPVKTVRGMKMALDLFKKGVGKDQLNLLMEHGGLMVGTDDVQLSAIGDIGVGVDKYLSTLGEHDVKLVQHLTEPIDKYINQPINHITWESLHTGSKLHIANELLTNILAKNPGMDPKVAAKEVSAHVNTVFGGINWTEIAADTNRKFNATLQIKNPIGRAIARNTMRPLTYAADKLGGIQGRERAQLILFAPDWTVSAFRSVTNALPQSFNIKEGVKGYINPKTRADLARRYVTNAAVAYFTIMNGINYAFNGKPIWENEDPTKIALGDGRSIQVAKHMMEFIEWVRHPLDTAGNKLAFFPKAFATITMGRTNPFNEKSSLKGEKDMSGPHKAANRVWEVAKSALPFQVSGAMRGEEGEMLAAGLSSFAGMPITGHQDSLHKPTEVKKNQRKARVEKSKANIPELKAKLKEKLKGKGY